MVLDSNIIIDFLNGRKETIAIQLRKNLKIKLPDAIIYATAKFKNTKLITRNTKDFSPKLKDVKIPYRVS